ncbi:hypothetical protein SVAN01_02114 [Stagonosporopsis vannaccii]|nr:hypothetical protein SVAN01_02114 [Stagonosporopsis vannaccii]
MQSSEATFTRRDTVDVMPNEPAAGGTTGGGAPRYTGALGWLHAAASPQMAFTVIAFTDRLFLRQVFDTPTLSHGCPRSGHTRHPRTAYRAPLRRPMRAFLMTLGRAPVSRNRADSLLFTIGNKMKGQPMKRGPDSQAWQAQFWSLAARLDSSPS